MYSSTISLTSVLDGSGWSTPRPGRFTPLKEPVSLYRRLGGPQSRSGQVRKISPPPGFDPRIVQPVAYRYTDCSILVPQVGVVLTKFVEEAPITIPKAFCPRLTRLHSKIINVVLLPRNPQDLRSKCTEYRVDYNFISPCNSCLEQC